MERWRERLRDVPGLKVGIAWQGNPRHKLDRHRSFPLALLEPIARLEGISLVSMQKGAGAEQLLSWANRFNFLDIGPQSGGVHGHRGRNEMSGPGPLLRHFGRPSGRHPGGERLGALLDHRGLALAFRARGHPLVSHHASFPPGSLGEWKPVFERMAAELSDLQRLKIKNQQ